jgi:hypothetical protein
VDEIVLEGCVPLIVGDVPVVLPERSRSNSRSRIPRSLSSQDLFDTTSATPELDPLEAAEGPESPGVLGNHFSGSVSLITGATAVAGRRYARSPTPFPSPVPRAHHRDSCWLPKPPDYLTATQDEGKVKYEFLVELSRFNL